MLDYIEIGQRIKKRRKSLNLTQLQLAEMVNLTESSISRYENGEVEAVIVIEPQRLSRGSMIDIGRITNTLQYSNTKVITPLKTYDLTDKFDRKMFESELLRGNEYLEYVKEILTRGRQKSVNDGLYIGSIAPFGYDRVKLKKGYTLKPNEDADTVRYIFYCYLNGMGTGKLAKHLIELGVKSKNNHSWTINMVRNILTSEIYIGMVTYGKNENVKSMVDGEIIKSRKRNKDYFVAKGLHEPLIPNEVFEEVQLTLRKRLNRPLRNNTAQRNPLANILKCGLCGKTMIMKCDGKKTYYLRCPEFTCANVSSRFEIVEKRVLTHLQNELKEYKYYVANYDKEVNADRKLYDKQLKKIDKQLDQLTKDLQNALINYNRNIITDEEYMFLKNYTTEEKNKLNDARQTITDKLAIKETNSKKNAIPILEKCISKYDCLTVEDKSKMLQAIIDRIEYRKEKARGEFSLELYMKL